MYTSALPKTPVSGMDTTAEQSNQALALSSPLCVWQAVHSPALQFLPNSLFSLSLEMKPFSLALWLIIFLNFLVCYFFQALYMLQFELFSSFLSKLILVSAKFVNLIVVLKNGGSKPCVET